MTLKLKGMEKMRAHREVRLTEDSALVISISEYRGEMRLDVRKFWLPRGNSAEGTFIPTKKGVNLSLYDQGPEFLQALVEAVGEADENLLDIIR